MPINSVLEDTSSLSLFYFPDDEEWVPDYDMLNGCLVECSPSGTTVLSCETARFSSDIRFYSRVNSTTDSIKTGTDKEW